jgi:hypothetical protein
MAEKPNNPKSKRDQPKTPEADEKNYEHEARVAWLRQADDCNSLHFWIGVMTTRLRERDVPAQLRAELTVMLARMTSAADLKRGRI